MSFEWVSVIVVLTIFGLIWKVGQWMGGMNEHVGTVKDFMQKIRNDIKQIFVRLPPVSVASGSPVVLTDFGREISNHIDAETWASHTAPDLLGNVRGNKDFETDAYCELYVSEHLDEKMLLQAAATAYTMGTKQDGVRAVLRVVLRDALLKLMEEGAEAS